MEAPAHDISDEDIIQRILNGESAAYELIMRRYNQRLFRVARSILLDDDTAQDATQQAYINAYYKLGSFKKTGFFAAWLTRITVNEALKILRQQSRLLNNHRLTSENQLIEEIVAPLTDPSDIASNRELATVIENAIDQLPGSFRSVFMLRAIQELSTRETSLSLGIPEATVKTRFHRAKNMIQNQLLPELETNELSAFKFAGSRCNSIVHHIKGCLPLQAANAL